MNGIKALRVHLSTWSAWSEPHDRTGAATSDPL